MNVPHRNDDIMHCLDRQLIYLLKCKQVPVNNCTWVKCDSHCFNYINCYNPHMIRARVISAMDIRKRFGEIMNRVSLRGERYIVERAGKPLMMMLPVAPLIKKAMAKKINMADPFENPFATFTEWNDPSNDIYDTL